MEEFVEKIKGKMQTDLKISRIPKNTRNRFLEIANQEDFCRDYGMALKMLVDFYDGLIPSGLEHIEVGMEGMNSRIAVIENKLLELDSEKRMKKSKKSLGGKEVRLG